MFIQPDKYAYSKLIFCLQNFKKLERKSLHADGILLINEKYIIKKFTGSLVFHSPGQSSLTWLQYAPPGF